jgi:hypothetical protein
MRRVLWTAFAWLVPRPEATGGFRVLHEITFDYLRNRSVRISPLDKGWKKGYGHGEPDFSTHPEIPGSLSMKIRQGTFAMDYPVPQHAKLADHISFTAKFISDAFFFAKKPINPLGVSLTIKGGRPVAWSVRNPRKLKRVTSGCSQRLPKCSMSFSFSVQTNSMMSESGTRFSVVLFMKGRV